MVGMTASALMGVMTPVLRKLNTILGKEYEKLKGVRKKVADLRDELSSMKAALEIVSESEEARPDVKEWMSQLRELSYDAEDCIEIFMHSLAHDDTRDGLIHRITSKIISLKSRYRINIQVKELKERAIEVHNRHKRYEVGPSISHSKSDEIDPRFHAIYEDTDKLVGIDTQVDLLVKWLTDGVDLQPNCIFVSIVGCGGSGKTTLSKQVFEKIKYQFDCSAFVSVSRSPNVKKILSDAFLQVLKSSIADQNGHTLRIPEDSQLLEYPQLVKMIRDYLINKRYFVIIDDIWSKQAWKDIQCAFPQNENASRIIGTTRKEDVAKCCSFPHKDYVHHMKPLDSNDSKRLFFSRVFGHKDDCPLELKDVTEDILRKCNGLPLAIVNIASLLSTKTTSKQEWMMVKNSLCSAFEQAGELEVLQRILFLSYYDLPHYLKICLMDLSTFPEDSEIDRLRLLRRWMAEGFIIEQKGQCLEETGENYIRELISRNMIQAVDVDYIGRPRSCRVHDIMLDLIITLSTKENFVTIVGDHKSSSLAYNIRRLSIQGYSEERKLWQGNYSLSHVRALSVFRNVKNFPTLSDFDIIRVLDLQDCSNLEDSDIGDIGSLIHLRYLSINNISKIPKRIGNLDHLQTLDLSRTRINELPGTVVQLHRLLHLIISCDVSLPDG